MSYDIGLQDGRNHYIAGNQGWLSLMNQLEENAGLKNFPQIGHVAACETYSLDFDEPEPVKQGASLPDLRDELDTILKLDWDADAFQVWTEFRDWVNEVLPKGEKP